MASKIVERRKAAGLCIRCGKRDEDRKPRPGRVTCGPCGEKVNKAANKTLEWQLIENARRRAKKKGLPFSIKRKDIHIPERCPLLDIEIIPSKGKMATDNSPSIDRFDPRFGYIPGNVWVISLKANYLKQDRNPTELAAYAQKLVTDAEQLLKFSSRIQDELSKRATAQKDCGS